MSGNCCDNNNKHYLSHVIYDCDPFVCPGFPELSLEPCDNMCNVIKVIMDALCELKSAVGFTNVNVGGGQEVFRDSIGTNENFRTLVAGPSGDISVTTVGDTIQIDFIGSDLNTTYDLTSVQNGSDSDITLTGSDATTDVVKLVAGSNITITDTGSNITIDGTAVGEVNTASNVGAGIGIFYQKTGVDLEFKSLVAGLGVTLDNVSDPLEIVISATAGLQEACIGVSNDYDTVPGPYTAANNVPSLQHTITVAGTYHIAVSLNTTTQPNDSTEFRLFKNGLALSGLGWFQAKTAAATGDDVDICHWEECAALVVGDVINVVAFAIAAGRGVDVGSSALFIQRID